MKWEGPVTSNCRQDNVWQPESTTGMSRIRKKVFRRTEFLYHFLDLLAIKFVFKRLATLV